MVDILSVIPIGHKNAITRYQLQIKTGLSDRKVRKLIEDSFDSDHPIINLQDGKGYFIPADDEMHLARMYRNQ